MTQKQMLFSAGDGTSVPAGNVGEIIQSAVTVLANVGASNQWFDATSITLTPGVWLINSVIYYDRNGATITDSSLVIGLSVNSGNSNAGSTPPINWFDTATGTLSTSFTRVPIHLNVYCRYDGTTLTFSNGTTLTPTNSIFYLKGYSFTYSAGTPRYLCNLMAIRLA